MLENRNNNNTLSCNTKGTVCIDTHRILDSCRDRDCFENMRVYLTESGEEILQNATNVRTRSAQLLWAFVGVDEVPFNCGFYRVTVRYYVLVELEGCLAGRSQSFKGISVFEKDVVLYGGEGRAVTFSSGTGNSYCSVCDMDNMGTNDPVAVVETVEPIVLGTKVNDCNCGCVCTDYTEIPEGVRNCIGEDLVLNSLGPKILVSFGIFSVVRIERPAQLLVQATDYSVPDKECSAASNNDNPCSLFRTIAFPTNQFRGAGTIPEATVRGGGSCGCNRN